MIRALFAPCPKGTAGGRDQSVDPALCGEWVSIIALSGMEATAEGLCLNESHRASLSPQSVSRVAAMMPDHHQFDPPRLLLVEKMIGEIREVRPPDDLT